MSPHALLVPMIASAIVAYASAFEGGKPTCDRYILNTYLYAVTYVFAFFYVAIIVAGQPRILARMNFYTYIALIVANIASFLTILFVSPQRYVLKHFASAFYIVTAGGLFSIFLLIFGSKAVAHAAALSIALFAMLAIAAFKFQDWISSRVSIVFIAIFVLMAIAEFVVGLAYPSSSLERVIVFAVLMLICYLVLVKTKRMIENAEKCEHPDYVRESIGFIVSFQNIILRVLGLRRGRAKILRR